MVPVFAEISSPPASSYEIESKRQTMARTCDLCNKGRLVGNKVSHSNIKTKKVQQVNLRPVHALVGGSTKRLRVCTRCLRSGKVEKSA